MNYSCKEDKLESEPGALFFHVRTLPIRIKKKLSVKAQSHSVILCLTQIPEPGLEMDYQMMSLF